MLGDDIKNLQSDVPTVIESPDLWRHSDAVASPMSDSPTDQDPGVSGPNPMRALQRLGWPSSRVVEFNALDPRMVDGRREAVWSWILMGLVLINGGVAFGAFSLASKVFFDLAPSQQVLAGLLVGALVAFIDWMIISWHPSLPRWFVAGEPKPPIRATIATVVGLTASALTMLGLIAYRPDLHWAGHALYAGAAGPAAAAVTWATWGLLEKNGMTAQPVAAMPRMPGFLQRLAPFAVRLLLTAFLGLVVGTGLSVVMNEEAVEQARDLIARDAALADVQSRYDDEFEAETTTYSAAVTAATTRQKLADSLATRILGQSDLVGARRADLTAAEEKSAFERSPESGQRGGEGLRLARLVEEAARTSYEDANAALSALQDEAAALAEEAVPPLVAPIQRAATVDDVTPEDLQAARDGATGLAATLAALEKAAEVQNWPWWLKWGPELVIFVVDMIPVLLKLLLGYQRPEMRTWGRDVEETLEDHAGVAPLFYARAQKQVVAEVEVSSARDLAMADGTAQLEIVAAVAKVNLQTQKELAERVGRAELEIAAMVAAVELQTQRELVAMAARAKLEDARRAPTLRQDEAPSEADASAVRVTDRVRSAAVTNKNPRPPIPEVRITVQGQHYLLGPLVSAQDVTSRNDVRVAVRVPPGDASIAIPDVNGLVTRCVVVKTKGRDVSESDWQRMSHAHTNMDPNGERFHVLDDGRLVHTSYYPRGDLARYLNQLHLEDIQIPYREAARWTMNVAEELRRIHDGDHVHGDVKASNTLVKGAMQVNQPRIAAVLFQPLVLVDFDTLTKAGTDLIGCSMTDAAPEVLDELSPTYYRASFSADVFAAGALLFYTLTGRPINSLIAQGPLDEVNWEGWQARYARNIDATLAKAGTIPDRLAKILSATLAPDPAHRCTAADLVDMIEETIPSLTGTYPAPNCGGVLPPPGLGPELLDVFRQLNYNIQGVSK